MERFLLFILSFTVIYLIYFLTVVLQKKKQEKYKNISFNKFISLLSFTNSLIMSFTILIISFIPNFYLKLVVAFCLLIPLILIGYDLLGRYVSKKEGKK